MSLNSVQSFVIENCNGPTIENGLNNVCLHPLSRTFTFTAHFTVAMQYYLLSNVSVKHLCLNMSQSETAAYVTNTVDSKKHR